MPDEYIIRQEYEARSALISNDLNKLEAKIDSLNTKVDTRFESLNNKVDGINTGMWKFVAITCINFIIGGGTGIAIVELLIRK